DGFVPCAACPGRPTDFRSATEEDHPSRTRWQIRTVEPVHVDTRRDASSGVVATVPGPAMFSGRARSLPPIANDAAARSVNREPHAIVFPVRRPRQDEPDVGLGSERIGTVRQGLRDRGKLVRGSAARLARIDRDPDGGGPGAIAVRLPNAYEV